MASHEVIKEEVIDKLVMQNILAFFGCGDLKDFHRAKKGKTNHTFFANTKNGDIYAVRILDAPDAAILENEHAIQQKLEDSKIAASCMVESATGEYVYKSENIWATVTPFIDGHHPKLPVSPEGCFLVGSKLAKFHELLMDTKLPFERKSAFVENERTVRRINALPKSTRTLTLRHLFRQANAVKRDGLPSGIVHGDFHGDNLLFHKDDLTILDFENAGTGPFIFDMGRSMADICGDSQGLNAEGARAFIRGYESTRKLTKEEVRLLPMCVVYGAAATSAWFYEYGNMKFAAHFLRVAEGAQKFFVI